MYSKIIIVGFWGIVGELANLVEWDADMGVIMVGGWKRVLKG